MKKLALLLIGGLLGFLLCYFFFCNTLAMTDDGTKPPPKPSTMDGVRLYLGVNNGLTTLMFVPTSSQITMEEQEKSKGSMFNLSTKRQTGGGDIKTLEGLDYGGAGNPPGANYPQ